MNNHFVGTFSFFGTLLLIVALIISNSFSEFEKYYIHDDIDFVEVISTEHRKDVLTTSNKAHILILTNCLRNIALNNICQGFTRQVSIAPQTYEITFYFANGKTETFSYTVYPAVKYPAAKYNQPLRPFFDLYGYY